MIKFLGVKKQIFVIFPLLKYTVKLVCVVTKNCHEGSPLFSVFGHTYLGSGFRPIDMCVSQTSHEIYILKSPNGVPVAAQRLVHKLRILLLLVLSYN